MSTELGEEKTDGEPKTTTYANWKKAAERKVYGAEKSNGWGGINWTSELGQSGESRVADENVRSESIDGITSAMGATPRANGGLGKTIPKSIVGLIKANLNNIKNGYDIKKVANSLMKGNVEPDVKYTCPTCDKSFSSKETSEHNEDLNRKSAASQGGYKAVKE